MKYSFRAPNSGEKTKLNLSSEHCAWNFFRNNGGHYQSIIKQIDRLHSVINTHVTSPSCYKQRPPPTSRLVCCFFQQKTTSQMHMLHGMETVNDELVRMRKEAVLSYTSVYLRKQRILRNISVRISHLRAENGDQNLPSMKHKYN